MKNNKCLKPPTSNIFKHGNLNHQTRGFHHQNRGRGNWPRSAVGLRVDMYIASYIYIYIYSFFAVSIPNDMKIHHESRSFQETISFPHPFRVFTLGYPSLFIV